MSTSIATPHYSLGIVHSVYHSDMPDCKYPYKVNLRCGVCSCKAGFIMSKTPKPKMYQIIGALRKGGAVIDLIEDDLGLRCYSCA